MTALRAVVLGLAAVVAYALEASLFPFLPPYGVRPDLLLALVVAYGLVDGTPSAVGIALVGGALTDLFDGRFYGLYTGLYVAQALAVGTLRRQIFHENPLAPVAVAFALGLGGSLAGWAALRLVRAAVPLGPALHVGAEDALYTAALALALDRMLRRRRLRARLRRP